MGKYSRKCYLCSATQINKTKSTISLYQFPRDSVTRSLWINFCNLFETDDVSLLKICSRHFQTSDFIEPRALEFGNRLILKNGAIPSIYKPKQKQRELDALLNKIEPTFLSLPYESSSLMCRTLNVIDRQSKPDNNYQLFKESEKILETEKLYIKSEPEFICPSYESSTLTCENVINRQSVLEDNLKESEESETIAETEKLYIKTEPVFICPSYESSTSSCQNLNIINRQSVPEDNLKVFEESENILETEKLYIKTEPVFTCPSYESSTSTCQNGINRQSLPEDNLKVFEDILETKTIIKTESILCPPCEPSIFQSLNAINKQNVPENNLKVSEESKEILETDKLYIKTEPEFICPTYEPSTSVCQSLDVINRQSVPEDNLRVSRESEKILETIIKTESILCSPYEPSTSLCQSLDVIHRQREPEDKLHLFEESENVLRTETIPESSQHINTDDCGCCTAKKRRFVEPRYIGDMSSSHLRTPEHAKRTLKLAKSIIAKKTMKIKSLQQTTRRLKKRIAMLKKSSA